MPTVVTLHRRNGLKTQGIAEQKTYKKTINRLKTSVFKSLFLSKDPNPKWSLTNKT